MAGNLRDRLAAVLDSGNNAAGLQLWREFQQISGNASVSVVCGRTRRAARLTALRNAIDAERAARGPARRGRKTS